MLALSFFLLGLHFAAGLAGAAIPLYRNLRFYLWKIAPIILILAIKTVISMAMPVGGYGEYKDYAFNTSFLIRECITIVSFYAWFYFGLHSYNYRILRSHRNSFLLLLLIFAPLSQFIVSGSVDLYAVDASQIFFLFLIFMIFVDRHSDLLSLSVAFAALAITATSLLSSYTTISATMLVFIYASRTANLGRQIVTCRPVMITAVIILTFASLFAYLVNFKDDSLSRTKGNNGYTRSILATEAFSTYAEFPLVGTPFGRGIMPVRVVKALGWEQYFDPEIAREMAEAVTENGSSDASYDIYAISFHNGFLYLLTRFGIFSILLIYLILSHAPRRAPFMVVVFAVVVLLSISANVVIESVRSGPGVGFVLGVLFSVRRAQDLDSPWRGRAAKAVGLLAPKEAFRAAPASLGARTFKKSDTSST